MPSNYLQGNTATPLPNQPSASFGLEVAFINYEGLQPIVAIQVNDDVLIEHLQAEKRWKNLSKLFPDTEVSYGVSQVKLRLASLQVVKS